MSQAIKVIVLTTSYPVKNFSDAGHFVESECSLLAARGIDVKVIAPAFPGKDLKEEVGELNVRRFHYFIPKYFEKVAYGAGMQVNLKNSWLARLQLPFFFFYFWLTVRKHSKDADILHCHWFPAALVAVLVRRSHQKVVLTMHHTHRPSVLLKWILKRTDYLFSNSKSTEAATFRIFPVKNRSVLYPGVDTNVYQPDINSKNTEIGFRVLFVGRLIPLKGTEVAIRAFDLFIKHAELKDAELHLIGDGPEIHNLKSLVRSLELEKYVKFHGNLMRNEIVRHYQESHVLVMPSLIMPGGETEGLGMVAMEAASCALPVIASLVGGIPEIVEDGVNGYLINAGNADEIASRLKELRLNSDLRKEMGRNGREKVLRSFSSDRGVNLIIETYKSLK